MKHGSGQNDLCEQPALLELDTTRPVVRVAHCVVGVASHRYGTPPPGMHHFPCKIPNRHLDMHAHILFTQVLFPLPHTCRMPASSHYRVCVTCIRRSQLSDNRRADVWTNAAMVAQARFSKCGPSVLVPSACRAPMYRVIGGSVLVPSPRYDSNPSGGQYLCGRCRYKVTYTFIWTWHSGR